MMWPSDARLVSPGYNLAETFFGVHGNLSLGAPTIVVTHIVQASAAFRLEVCTCTMVSM